MADGAGGGPARPGAAAPGASVYTEALGQAICRRVLAGESLRAICAGPGSPHRTTLRAWMTRHPEFAQGLVAAQQAARLAWRRRDRACFAHLAARPKPRRGGKPSTYTPAMGEAICARLMEGESLTAIARDPAMPAYATILGWVRRHPEFEDMYVQARQVQADYFCDEARDVALAATPETVWVARLCFSVIRWQAARLAPRKYVERVAVMEAVAEQRRAEAEAAAMRPDSLICVTHFERSPDGKTILAVPPRNAEEEARWEAAHGKPYDGPLYQVVHRWEERQGRRA